MKSKLDHFLEALMSMSAMAFLLLMAANAMPQAKAVSGHTFIDTAKQTAAAANPEQGTQPPLSSAEADSTLDPARVHSAHGRLAPTNKG
jgi:hypothetical protein